MCPDCTGVHLFVFLLALLTFERNRVWSEAATLWLDAAGKNPQAARPYVYLGNSARAQGDPEAEGKIDSALYYYQRARGLTQARDNRARLLGQELLQIETWLDQGQTQVAEAWCRLLLKAEPRDQDALFLLVVSLFQQACYSESISENQRLVELHPRFDEGILQLAYGLESSGRLVEAKTAYQTLLERTRRADMRQIGRERLRSLEERMP